MKFSNRSKYIEVIGSMQGIRLHSKLRELRACLSGWDNSSTAHQNVFKTLSKVLISDHVTDIVDLDLSYLSAKDLKEILGVTGVSIKDILVELLIAMKSGGYNVDAAIWMSIAAMLAEEVEGKGQ